MRKSSWMLLAFFVSLVFAVLTVIDSYQTQELANERLSRNAKLVGKLGLSDLALFTEARYTRHPSLADRHSAFQDHPVSLDYFPTGSLVPPPGHLQP